MTRALSCKDKDSLSLRTATAVRVEMARQDLSAAQLAASLGVEPRVLQRRLKGRSPWTLEWLDAVARALGVPPQKFVSDDATADAA
jgi:antitoxin component HigA of HigAB toxin-antitoxin module